MEGKGEREGGEEKKRAREQERQNLKENEEVVEEAGERERERRERGQREREREERERAEREREREREREERERASGTRCLATLSTLPPAWSLTPPRAAFSAPPAPPTSSAHRSGARPHTELSPSTARGPCSVPRRGGSFLALWSRTTRL